MKILLIDFKNKQSPRAIKSHHIEKVKRVLGKTDDLIFVSPDQNLLTSAINADVVAGFPDSLSSITLGENVRWIHSFSAGVNKFLTPELIQSPIIISNSSGIHATPIAEHVIGFILIFSRLFHMTLRNQDRKRWEVREDIREFNGKTILVVGLGHIGNEVARLSHAFGARIIAVGRTQKKKPAFVDELKTADFLDTMLPKADFVVLCLPYTKDTHHLFNREKFKKMKQSGIIINIGRGSVINEKNLIQALQDKIIGGAALDVTEIEPLSSESPLWKMENVIITPHHSGLSEKYMDRAIELFCKNFEAFAQNKKLPNQIDKGRGY